MIITSHILDSELHRQSSAIISQYLAWCYEIKHEHWTDGSDILEHYPKAELCSSNKVIFHILKGKAIIYTHVDYSLKRVFVRFVGPVEDFEKNIKRTVA